MDLAWFLFFPPGGTAALGKTRKDTIAVPIADVFSDSTSFIQKVAEVSPYPIVVIAEVRTFKGMTSHFFQSISLSDKLLDALQAYIPSTYSKHMIDKPWFYNFFITLRSQSDSLNFT